MLHGNPTKEDDNLDEVKTQAEETLEALYEIPSAIRDAVSPSASSAGGDGGSTGGAADKADAPADSSPETQEAEVTPDVPDDNTFRDTPAERSVDADVSADRTEEQPEEVTEAAGAIYEVTAYVATCDGCTGVTYSGYDVRQTIYTPEGYRVIATDPAVIPTGTLVQLTYADGRTETARAEDIGSGINGMEADLLVAAEAEALEFGRKDVEVTILDEG